PGTVLRADVCVVGAGAAGIALSRALAAARLDVLLVESGDREPRAEVQDLAGGQVVGHNYQPLAATRVRALGGTTGHWTGFCRPLDAVDLEARPAVPDSGWPFAREELDAWYEAAHEVLELGPYEYDPDWWHDAYRTGEPLVDGPDVETILYQISSTRFGDTYRGELRRSRRVTVCLNANVVRLAATPGAGAVTQVEIATLTGRRLHARAACYVLAAGALENARLLLLSSDVQASGLGNGHDLVGRYFMDHPHVAAGPVIFTRDRASLSSYGARVVRLDPAKGARRDQHDQLVWSAIALTGEARRRLGVLGFSATLHFEGEFVPGDVPLTHLASDVRGLAADVRTARLRRSRRPAATPATLYLRCEQSPNRDSRVVLGDERDALGLPRARLEWRLAPTDIGSAAATMALLSGEMGRTGLGIVRVAPPTGEDLFTAAQGGPHQLGTARMHDDPRRGVVDGDCRAHSVDNLYVTGGAVFPTSGYANPTLTIVALALRLAAHLRRRLA
ncbi:MAG: FAD-dependent oxidoreductase, partial [Acidimicrobiia bacterium]